jgi:hypothetical protein
LVNTNSDIEDRREVSRQMRKGTQKDNIIYIYIYIYIYYIWQVVAGGRRWLDGGEGGEAQFVLT